MQAEGAGRLRSPFKRLYFHENEIVLRAVPRVSRLTQMCASVSTVTTPAAPNELPRQSSTPLRIFPVGGRSAEQDGARRV